MLALKCYNYLWETLYACFVGGFELTHSHIRSIRVESTHRRK